MSKELDNVKKELKEMKAALASSSTPENMKPIFKKTIETLEKKLQGYNDKLDESLAKDGKESTKKQSFKDRRDESKGMEKSKGKRAYSSDPDMDKQKTKSKKTTAKVDYDCDELIEKEKAKAKKAKTAAAKRAKKPGSKKNVERIEKATEVVEKSIKERKESGKQPTIAEIKALIKEHEDAIKMLKKQLEALEKKSPVKSTEPKGSKDKMKILKDAKRYFIDMGMIEQMTSDKATYTNALLKFADKPYYSSQEGEAIDFWDKTGVIVELKSDERYYVDALLKNAKSKKAGNYGASGKPTMKTDSKGNTTIEYTKPPAPKGPKVIVNKLSDYIFVQTWNGDGYSDENKIVKRGKYSKGELFDQAKKIAENSFGKGSYEKLDNGWSFEDGEDYGSIQFFAIDDKKKQYGIVIFTNVNEVKVLPERKFKSERAKVAELFLDSGEYAAEDSENGKGRNFFTQEDIDYNYQVAGDDSESDYQFEII